MNNIRQYFVQNLIFGVIILTPFIATFYVTVALLNFSDTFLFSLLPIRYRPDQVLGFHIPGMGILLTVLIIFAVGAFTKNYFGKKMVTLFEQFIDRIPVLRSVYNALRQFLESVLVNRSSAFKKAVAIEYPRKGLYTLAFVTSETANFLRGHIKDEKIFTVFVPTTPNPTSGFFLAVPESEIIEIPIKVDEAFRLVVSGGVLGDQNKIL